MISGVGREAVRQDRYWKDERCAIELVAIRQLKLLIDLKRENRNNICAVGYEPLLESRNSVVYAIKIGERILGVIKVAHNHERAFIEEIKWNIAVCLGDSDNFVPTIAWNYRDPSMMSGGEDFSGRIDSQGRFSIDRGLKKPKCYAFEPYIEGYHVPVKDRGEWLKTAFMGIVYGIFDGHDKNMLYDEKAKRAYLIDYVQTMPPRNVPLVWSSVLRPFLRLAHMCDAYAAQPFTQEEKQSIYERLQKYHDSLPRLKAYLNAFIVRKKLCYVDKSQFDPELGVNALEERIDKTKRLLDGGVSTFREIIFKLCPFYEWQALFIHLEQFRCGHGYNPQKFEGVGNCELSTIIVNLLNAGISPSDVIQDLENDMPFYEILSKYKPKFYINASDSLSDRSKAFYKKLDHVNRSAVFSGADVHSDRHLFQLDYYRDRLKIAGIKFDEINGWLYVYYNGLRLAVHPLIIPDKIHLLYKEGNLPLMTFEEFKKRPSPEVKYAMHILDYCALKRIKVIAAEKVALIIKWAGLKRGESFVGQIHDKAEFILFYRKVNGKRGQKPIKLTEDIYFKDDPALAYVKSSSFVDLDALKIPYKIENGLGWINIHNERCSFYSLHSYYVVSVGKGELPPMTALHLDAWLKGDMWEFHVLKFLSHLNFCLADFQQDIPVVQSYLIQQIKGSSTFYLYKKDVPILKEYRMEIRPNQIQITDQFGIKASYPLE